MHVATKSEEGWGIYKTYTDDDEVGINFDRPGFAAMMHDIDRGRVNMVITKTLSRFGRNRIEAPRHREMLYEKGVRYIALHDGHDSLRDGCFDVASSVHEIINEKHCADVSREVRRTKRLRGSQGKFTNGQQPYGFIKDPDDLHHFLHDSVAAPIVQRIFKEYADGMSGREIANRLTAEGFDCPSHYHFKKAKPIKKNGKPHKPLRNPNIWDCNSIMALLKHRSYIGDMVSCTRENVSYKSKKRVQVPKDEHIIVEGTHQPIIERKLWDTVQDKINSKQRVRSSKKTGKPGIFSGIVWCADCKGRMSYENDKDRYRCSAYLRKDGCSSHIVYQSALSEYVLGDIHRNAALSVAERNRLTDRLLTAMRQMQTAEAGVVESQINSYETRLSVIETIVDGLYEDKATKVITPAEYARRKAKYTQEQQQLEAELPRLRRERDSIREAAADIEDWHKLIENCIEIETMDRETAMGLIKQITVGERVKNDGKTTQSIEIHYRFIGNELNAKEDAAVQANTL
jgi:DNA invertase Pin-like site-specific DNA recombinase